MRETAAKGPENKRAKRRTRTCPSETDEELKTNMARLRRRYE